MSSSANSLTSTKSKGDKASANANNDTASALASSSAKSVSWKKKSKAKKPSTSSTNTNGNDVATSSTSSVRKSTKQAASSSSSIRKPPKPAAPLSNDNSIYRVDFQIRGKVQGVHFRKYTQKKATSLGIRGWCKNTEYGTVIGIMEGTRIKVAQMKQWLKSTGSPKSIISGAEFKDTFMEKYTLVEGFQITK